MTGIPVCSDPLIGIPVHSDPVIDAPVYGRRLYLDTYAGVVAVPLGRGMRRPGPVPGDLEPSRVDFEACS